MQTKDTRQRAGAPVLRTVLKLKPRKRVPPTRGATCFWINWRYPNGMRAKKQHATLESALAERDRLRTLVPDATFRTFECREVTTP